jgi:predicted metal-dependent HD superfamily phosphohydrolase
MISLDLRSKLTVLYGEPHRHYHNLSHVQHCLRELKELMDVESISKPDVSERLAIEYAIWFHDSVYDPKAPWGQNEIDSAQLAWDSLYKYQELTVGKSIVSSIVKMIEATSGHLVYDKLDLATQYFLDIDLSILGADEKTYQEYAENIRKEYSFVEKSVYVENRKKILEKFLARRNIYSTEHFRNKYESKARSNIQFELRLLPYVT